MSNFISMHFHYQLFYAKTCFLCSHAPETYLAVIGLYFYHYSYSTITSFPLCHTRNDFENNPYYEVGIVISMLVKIRYSEGYVIVFFHHISQVITLKSGSLFQLLT